MEISSRSELLGRLAKLEQILDGHRPEGKRRNGTKENEASKQDSKQSGFSGLCCSWKRGTKNLLISCHFLFFCEVWAAQLNANAETRIFLGGLVFCCDLCVFLIFVLAACLSCCCKRKFISFLSFFVFQKKSDFHHVKRTRLFVRQAIQAKCTQAPRSFAEFEHLTQQKQQQALPEFMSSHAMNGWKILV